MEDVTTGKLRIKSICSCYFAISPVRRITVPRVRRSAFVSGAFASAGRSSNLEFTARA